MVSIRLFVLLGMFGYLDYWLFPKLFKSIFPNEGDFLEALKFNWTPDIFSFFKGNLYEDKISEFKLSILSGTYLLIIAVEFMGGQLLLSYF